MILSYFFSSDFILQSYEFYWKSGLLTKGRITINGEKQHGSETKAEAQTSATTDSQNKADVAADTKTKDKTKTEETKKPTPGFWGWGYYGALAAVCYGLFLFFRRYWHKN